FRRHDESKLARLVLQRRPKLLGAEVLIRAVEPPRRAVALHPVAFQVRQVQTRGLDAVVVQRDVAPLHHAPPARRMRWPYGDPPTSRLRDSGPGSWPAHLLDGPENLHAEERHALPIGRALATEPRPKILLPIARRSGTHELPSLPPPRTGIGGAAACGASRARRTAARNVVPVPTARETLTRRFRTSPSACAAAPAGTFSGASLKANRMNCPTVSATISSRSSTRPNT